MFPCSIQPGFCISLTEYLRKISEILVRHPVGVYDSPSLDITKIDGSTVWSCYCVHSSRCVVRKPRPSVVGVRVKRTDVIVSVSFCMLQLCLLHPYGKDPCRNVLLYLFSRDAYYLVIIRLRDRDCRVHHNQILV